MAKGKSTNIDRTTGKSKVNEKAHAAKGGIKSGDYLFHMSHAPRIGEDTHWFQMLPAVFFTAVVIMITRMASYDRPMSQFFFWGGSGSNITDFFSYYKMGAILVCALIVLLIILYRVFTQSFYVKRSIVYIPMIVYIVFVLLSYAGSDYKLFALWGWVDRLEGTLSLLSYMLLLFYIINMVNSEKNVKWIIYVLAVTSSILGLLGITQAMNHDFFRTTVGKQLITPSWFWGQLDKLNFTFTNQIYQTVYNINYVSFYLTLLIPIFGILFIRSMMLGKEESLRKKILWGALFTLLIFNLIGSASSGGLMGMAFVLLVALIVLNKRILQWRKPIAILIILTVIISGVTLSRWAPELSNAVSSVLGIKTEQAGIVQDESSDTSGLRHKIDYIVTSGNSINLSYKGDEISFITHPDDPSALNVEDSKGNPLTLVQPDPSASIFKVEDKRFNWISLKPAKDDVGNRYLVLTTDSTEWPFKISKAGVKYRSGSGAFLSLHKVPAIGWENNQAFGSGRGYIWSRTLPMIKDTLVLGHGADTYCIYFPQDDFVGKYNSGTFSDNVNILVDKPHNMYFDAIIGTGGISLLALLVLWGFYLVQSLLIYRKEKYENFVSYVGVGIFLGICGFMVSGLVDDSTVSVMPMFYGLLGTGISINMMLKRKLS